MVVQKFLVIFITVVPIFLSRERGEFRVIKETYLKVLNLILRTTRTD